MQIKGVGSLYIYILTRLSWPWKKSSNFFYVSRMNPSPPKKLENFNQSGAQVKYINLVGGFKPF